MGDALIENPTPFEASLIRAYEARPAPTPAQTAAMARFARQRMPHRRVEGWKWSDFNAALNAAPAQDAPNGAERAAGGIVIAPSAFASLNPVEVRIVGGRPDHPAAEDLPRGVRIAVARATALAPELESHPILSLNAAMADDALTLEIEAGAAPGRPILIRHILAGAAPVFVRTAVRVGAGASVEILETYEGAGPVLYSHFCGMTVGASARVERTAVQDAGGEGVLHALCAATLDEAARYDQTTLSAGARLARHETHLHYAGDGASARMDSAALVGGSRHCDITTHVRHDGAGCETRQIHKGVAKDRARTVFQGKFHVLPGAQKTDADMQANALLLSDTAEANHKPELEIYADDVECAHGSTAGALDEDALFYLRQRGLDERTARALLIEAFVGEAIDAIGRDEVRLALQALVSGWLEEAEA